MSSDLIKLHKVSKFIDPFASILLTYDGLNSESFVVTVDCIFGGIGDNTSGAVPYYVTRNK